MKKILIKFSDERNKAYSIRTTIVEEETTKEKYVLKENIYPEGKQHLKNIMHYAEILKVAYPDVEITPVCMLENGGLRFDFIEGESLDSRYRKCMEKSDKCHMERLLKMHKTLVLGAETNRCDFSMTEEFKMIFGLDEWKGRTDALKVTNFDATASNIIFKGQKPVFIDYEWIYEFPIPEELALYHCVRDMYYHIDGLQSFYPLDDAMTLLGITSSQDVLENAYKNFYSYVVCEKNGDSFSLSKTLFLKGNRVDAHVLQEEIEQLKWNNIFYEGQWKEACDANGVLTERITQLKQDYSKDKERLAQLETEHTQNVELIAQLEMEIAFVEKNWREACQAVKPQNDAEQWKLEAANWRAAYESVVNSKTWRLAGKIKRLLGKK